MTFEKPKIEHVAVITSELNAPNQNRVGGLGTYVWKMSRMLSDCNVHVSIIIPSERPRKDILQPGITAIYIKIPQKTTSFILKILNILTSKLFRISIIQLYHSLNKSKSISKALKKLNSETRISIVQYSNLGGWSYYHPKELPYCIRLSSITKIYYEHGRGYYGMPRYKVNAQIILEKICLRQAKNIISPSMAMLHLVQGYKKKNTRVIETPILKNLDTPGTETNNENMAYMFYFGSIDYRKGVDLLIEAYNCIRDDNLLCVLAGICQGDSSKDRMIKNIVLSNEDGIRYVGELTKTELISWIKNAKAVVLPSRVDNFPNTLVESLQYGGLVVGPDNWGFEQIIEDGKNGFLFKSGDLHSLIRSLRKALDLSDRQRTSFAIESQRIMERLQPKIIGDQLIEFYSSVIEEKMRACAG